MFDLIHPQEYINQCLLGAYGVNNSNNITWEINNDNAYLREEVDARGVGTSRPHASKYLREVLLESRHV